MGKIKKSVRIIANSILDICATRRVLVLGDSHAVIFRHPLFNAWFPRVQFEVCCVQGATASGLENPNSSTQAYRIFTEKLKTSRPDLVILLMGEVDTGFVIWHRAEKYGLSVDEMLTRTVDTYMEFITLVRQRFDTLVVSAPLPTIEDGNDWGRVANLRKTISATQAQRTELTQAFNSAVETSCRAQEIRFLNLDQASLGRNRLVRKQLLNRDPSNHHYDKMAHTKLLVPRIKGILKAL